MSYLENITRRTVVLGRSTIDLLAIAIASVSIYVAIFALPEGAYLRLAIALPFLFVFPGYALLAVVFPERGPIAKVTSTESEGSGGIDWIERLSLSLPISLAIVPAVSIGLAHSVIGLRFESIAIAVVSITVICCSIGLLRRLLLPPDQRVRVMPAELWKSVAPRYEARPQELVTSIVLVISILLFVIALGIGMIAPQATSGFTQFGLYTVNDDGELQTGAIPSTIDHDESIPLTVGIENNEGEGTWYTVYITEERMTDEGTATTVHSEIEVYLRDGSSYFANRTISPTAANGTVRISAFLYTDSSPADPSRETADDFLFLTVTVEEAPIGAVPESE